MARKVDITERLSFEESPVLVIKGKELEVNCDAPAVLKIMGLMGENGLETKDMNHAYELLFPEKTRKEIEKMKLNFNDWTKVVGAGLQVVTEDGTGGEQ